MDKISESILDVFGNDTRIGTRFDEPRTTRIGAVLFNKDAEIVSSQLTCDNQIMTQIADLNRYQSFVDLNNSLSEHLFNLSSSDESSLRKGLETAEAVLDKSMRTGERDNYKKVFIIYTPVLEG